MDLEKIAIFLILWELVESFIIKFITVISQDARWFYVQARFFGLSKKRAGKRKKKMNFWKVERFFLFSELFWIFNGIFQERINDN